MDTEDILASLRVQEDTLLEKYRDLIYSERDAYRDKKKTGRKLTNKRLVKIRDEPIIALKKETYCMHRIP
ncbi:MAG TPA: hypothetical protein EYG93_02885 [Sulfurospirillum arcachonense]|nr:hypothetical protein [Sulfurimonas autotrophica]HIP44267.1 hypothetical protein [Sulfurospirillum arcachonense]